MNVWYRVLRYAVWIALAVGAIAASSSLADNWLSLVFAALAGVLFFTAAKDYNVISGLAEKKD